MVLTPWAPAARVLVDGEDITGAIMPRLMSLSVNDGAGITSDSVDLALTDTDKLAPLRIPRAGAEIEVFLGYGAELKSMGLFLAEAADVGGPPGNMNIRGTASPHAETTSGATPLTQQKTRSFDDGTTFGELIAKVASDHGLAAAVSSRVASIVLPHVDQIDESDIALLTRLARDRDVLVKVAGGKVVAVIRGSGETPGGDPMPTITLSPGAVTSWRLRRSLREPAGQVVAVYRDTDAAEDKEATAGEGEPVVRLKERFPNEATAQEAANTEHRRSTRAGDSLSIAMPGDPDLIAEARLVLVGFHPDADGEFSITSVQHRFQPGAGYSCSLSAEVPGGEGEAE